jgi:hypothetical protein
MNLCTRHRGSKKREILASRAPKPVIKPQPSFVSTRRRGPIPFGILNFKLFKMIATNFLPCLSESTHRLKRSILLPNGHIVIDGGQLVGQPRGKLFERAS